MNLRRIWFTFSLILLLVPTSALAGGRTETIQEEVTEHIWSVVGPDGLELCRIISEGYWTPKSDLVRALCGTAVSDQLQKGEIGFRYLGSRELVKDKKVEVPDIEISLDVDFGSREAIIQAVDPSPGGEIAALGVTLNGSASACEGNPCRVPLRGGETSLVYWADSTLGDSTRYHTALIRLDEVPEVIGDRTYKGWDPADRIPRIWGTITPRSLPLWLQNSPGLNIYTDQPYYYLAGRLILSGSLGVPGCTGLGIVPYSGGYATQCGLEFAREAVTSHQNVYNTEILKASEKSGVPPWVLKGVIAQESQFWEDAHGHAGEDGLFQLSAAGADTLLRWSGSAYMEYCSRSFEDCEDIGYDNRDQGEKEALIYAVLEDADDIALLGEVLVAKAAQVDQLLENYWGISNPTDILRYEDLWMLTIITYNAGPDFTAEVLSQIYHRRMGRDWTSIGRVVWELNRRVHGYYRNVVRTCQGEELGLIPFPVP